MSKKNDVIRFNLQMSSQIVEFYQEIADELGIPRSGIMVMALKDYMDRQELIKNTSQMIKEIEDERNKLS